MEFVVGSALASGSSFADLYGAKIQGVLLKGISQNLASSVRSTYKERSLDLEHRSRYHLTILFHHKMYRMSPIQWRSVDLGPER